jgi:hypothetical protein
MGDQEVQPFRPKYRPVALVLVLFQTDLKALPGSREG